MTDHRGDADHIMNQGATATEHLLAAIHDLLAERLPTKGDPCPCGCPRTVEPKSCEAVSDTHVTKCEVDIGDATPCPCVLPLRHEGLHACKCSELIPEPETVTVTLPRAVVKEAVSRLRYAARSETLNRARSNGHTWIANQLADALERAL